MKIAILGLGLIGGSLAKAIKNVRPDIFISGFDLPEITAQAFAENVIDEQLLSSIDVKDSDIIFLCLPTELSIQEIERLAPVVKSGSIITDVCSVKRVLEKKWDLLQSDGKYIGGHPMTGKEKGGFENSDPILFENAIYILTGKEAELPSSQTLIDLLTAIGAKIKFLDASLHDTIVANVSHLPQLVAVSLVNAALNGDQHAFKDFAAGGFRDLTRIASSDFLIWEQIIRKNRIHILTALTKFQKTIADISTSIEKEDFSSLKLAFEKAKEKRDEIPKNSKGFLNPLSDIFIFVKDEPGVLFKMAEILFRNNISIKDVEILKMREGTGGTMRLSFDTKEIAKKAKGLIEQVGFKTR
ncbi:MAG: prephenate dehydrogenase [Ignavibacteria bacterium CG22_combo_CG10-13_8_21_14_all_37_15]|nr:MAG: prephenate dehydrogenase [Ignavibacteria bacterium CG22_combo_CG10-13_8_21_14_all_37_15]PIS45148.1 MAG: prephenate dehydrogenase/arogenate dehydrogenase family protein [Ignavibacteria bacterium CG08_land_8_20_14_0_20_37_9]PJC58015.1 MAG: prephenate dehydrogenase/arogenate dehydrogenase family protein [Ignavibacteria bacterium CG_4_9_14_0_2_um_filter_37_13]